MAERPASSTHCRTAFEGKNMFRAMSVCTELFPAYYQTLKGKGRWRKVKRSGCFSLYSNLKMVNNAKMLNEHITYNGKQKNCFEGRIRHCRCFESVVRTTLFRFRLSFSKGASWEPSSFYYYIKGCWRSFCYFL